MSYAVARWQVSNFAVSILLAVTFWIYVCLELKLAIEVDGGQHQEQLEQDQLRTERLAKAGFQVLRFWNNEVLQELDAVKEQIWLAVHELSPHLIPTAPLEGA